MPYIILSLLCLYSWTTNIMFELFLHYTHMISTLSMGAIIWFVQISHYPLLLFVPSQDFAKYERQHVYRVTFIVGPLMLLEVFSASFLLLKTTQEHMMLLTIGFISLIFIWISTLILQIPCHRILEKRKDDEVIKKLIKTNWIRTFLWTSRSVLAILIFSTFIKGI